MIKIDASTALVARYIAAFADSGSACVTVGDDDAAAQLGITVRTYRDCLRKIERYGAIVAEALDHGPTKRGAPKRTRTIYMNEYNPLWMWLIAADQLVEIGVQ
jgi:hypothetical protein